MSSIRTTVVGSYPASERLRAAPSAAALECEVVAAVRAQEAAGVDVISDGELRRFDLDHPETNGMIEHFVLELAGVNQELTREELQRFEECAEMGFRARPAAVVRGSIGAGGLDLAGEWRSMRGLSEAPFKFTLTSPYMLAKTLLDGHYQDPQALCHALAVVLAEQVRDIDAAVVQVDEANLTGNAHDGGWAHEPINLVLDAISGESGLHLCFGNYGGRTIQQGLWRDLMPFLNQLRVDHLLLEFARRGYDELEHFNELRPNIKLGVGVIDIKDPEVERADEVARRIDAAVGVLGGDRVGWVHPDCGFWMLTPEVANAKLSSLVRGRDLFLGS